MRYRFNVETPIHHHGFSFLEREFTSKIFKCFYFVFWSCFVSMFVWYGMLCLPRCGKMALEQLLIATRWITFALGPISWNSEFIVIVSIFFFFFFFFTILLYFLFYLLIEYLIDSLSGRFFWFFDNRLLSIHDDIRKLR